MASDDGQRPTDAQETLPFADSLCWRCAHHRAIRAARSVFVMCSALPEKYPRQPVITCASFQSKAPRQP